MDVDEYDFVKSDWSTYNDAREVESCSYCSDELDNLNIVHYEFNQETYDSNVVAVNPKPHKHIVIQEGYVKRTELVCDECLREELGYERH